MSTIYCFLSNKEEQRRKRKMIENRNGSYDDVMPSDELLRKLIIEDAQKDNLEARLDALEKNTGL